MSTVGEMSRSANVKGQQHVGPAICLIASILSWVYSSRNVFGKQDANWDLLNYHAYLPASLYAGEWLSDYHPAGIHSFLTPYLDLLTWPLVALVRGDVGSMVLMALQLSIVLPAALIARALAPEAHKAVTAAVGVMAASGAMVITELGTTMGDLVAAIPALWAVWLCVRRISLESRTTWRYWLLAGTLFGLSVALKFTLAYVVAGILAVMILLCLRKEFCNAAMLVIGTGFSCLTLYAPWGILLASNFGSPVFPMWNGVFQAARYPSENFDDSRFGAASVADVGALLLAPAVDPNRTSELFFRDLRWPLLAVVLIVAVTLLLSRRVTLPTAPLHSPVVLLLAFWFPSAVAWSVLFGIQRYAILLEVLLVPLIFGIIATFASSKTLWIIVASMSVLLAITTQSADFGRRPWSAAAVVPSLTLPPLHGAGAVILVDKPLAFLRAVTREDPAMSDVLWMSEPFNENDSLVGQAKLSESPTLVVAYDSNSGRAAQVARVFGRTITGCAPMASPMKNSLIADDLVVCQTSVP